MGEMNFPAKYFSRKNLICNVVGTIFQVFIAISVTKLVLVDLQVVQVCRVSLPVAVNLLERGTSPILMTSLRKMSLPSRDKKLC